MSLNALLRFLLRMRLFRVEFATFTWFEIWALFEQKSRRVFSSQFGPDETNMFHNLTPNKCFGSNIKAPKYCVLNEPTVLPANFSWLFNTQSQTVSKSKSTLFTHLKTDWNDELCKPKAPIHIIVAQQTNDITVYNKQSKRPFDFFFFTSICLFGFYREIETRTFPLNRKNAIAIPTFYERSLHNRKLLLLLKKFFCFCF